jgi:hypothetical protein
MMKCLVFGTFAYFQAPLVLAKGGVIVPVAIGIAVQLAIYTASTVLALLIDGSFMSKWRLLLAIPGATLYMPVYGFWAGAAGMTKDLLLVGNCTKFAPEATLIKGGSSRVALFARIRRAAILTVRSAIYGDVPLGSFWLGWGETPWTPSGYQGWTSGKRPSLYERLRFGAAKPVVVEQPALHVQPVAVADPVVEAVVEVPATLHEPLPVATARQGLRLVPGCGTPRQTTSGSIAPPSSASRAA